MTFKAGMLEHSPLLVYGDIKTACLSWPLFSHTL